MLRLLGYIFYALALTTVTSAANAAKPLSIKGLSQDETIEYVNGVGIALAYYDLNLRIAGKMPLYCVPDGEFGPHLIWSLASRALEGPHDKQLIVIAALDELQHHYPCN